MILNKSIRILAIFTLFIAGLSVVQAQTPADPNTSTDPIPKQTFGTDIVCRAQPLQYFRPTNQCGINMFEPPKENNVPFEGF
jgi:hypothetical protein